MGGEHVHGPPLPLDPRHPHPFPHEDLPVETPEAATVGEGDKADLGDRVTGQDGQPGAAEGQQEAGAPKVDALVICDVGHGGGNDVVVLTIPDLLKSGVMGYLWFLKLWKFYLKEHNVILAVDQLISKSTDSGGMASQAGMVGRLPVVFH